MQNNAKMTMVIYDSVSPVLFGFGKVPVGTGVDVEYKKICRDSPVILIYVGWKWEILFSH